MENTPLGAEEKAVLKEDITKAVDECLSNEEYKSKDEVIDKVIADLEAMKGGPEMGGLGSDEEMELPEAEGGEEEEQA